MKRTHLGVLLGPLIGAVDAGLMLPLTPSAAKHGADRPSGVCPKCTNRA